MIRYILSVITAKTNHPFVVSLFVLAAGFAAAGIFVEIVIENGTAAGFLLIYAGMATILGLFGYVALYLLKVASILREMAVRG